MAPKSISQTIVVPNLVQGVSQQASQQRRDSQAEDQWDCINSVLEGCVARPHFELVKLHGGVDFDGARFSEISYDTENYLTCFTTAGFPFAMDLADGTFCTVTNAAPNYGYLSAGGGLAFDRLRAQVQDDFTFVANRTVTTAMTADTSPAKKNEAIVFVRATALNTAFQLQLAGPALLNCNYDTSPTDVTSTRVIAAALAGQINGAPAAGYTAVQYGSVLHIYRADGQAFSVDTTDSNGDDFMRAFNGEVQNFEKLPAKAPSGVILKVRGERGTGADDYYVQFVGSPSTGSWQEVVGPGVPTTIDPATMPHALVLTGYRTFEFRRLVWSKRVAGDTTTVKDPSFIGRAIRDISYYSRRLCFIHGAGSVYSKNDAPFTFFPDTIQTVLASAPIDTKVASGSKKGSPVLDFAVLVAEGIFNWAQKAQFRHDSGNEVFKQETIETKVSSAYEYSPKAYPLDVGSFLFMSTDIGQWASLRALSYQNGRLVGDVDVSSHVAKYVNSAVTGLTGSDTLRAVFVQSDGDRQTLTLFNYTWDGQQFIQSAFNKWRIPGGNILWASLDKNYLRVLQQRPEGLALLRANLTPKAVDPITGAEYMTRLDIRVSEAQTAGLTYDETNQTTAFSLPFIPGSIPVQVVLSEDYGDNTRGREYEVVSVVSAVVTVKGDLRGRKFYVGHKITAERTESEFFIRTDNGAEPTDSITINRIKVALADTGYTRVEVTDVTGRVKAREFEGRVLGTSSSQTGTPKLRTDDLDVPVAHRSDEVSIRLINDSFLPSAWQSISYDIDAVGWKGAK